MRQEYQTFSIEPYLRPLNWWELTAALGIPFSTAVMTFYRQGVQAYGAVKTFGLDGTPAGKVLERILFYTSPLPLIFFSTLNGFEVWELFYRDRKLFFKVLREQKLRVFFCLLGALTSGYIASESESVISVITAVFSSLTTNGSFFVSRHPYAAKKEALIDMLEKIPSPNPGESSLSSVVSADSFSSDPDSEEPNFDIQLGALLRQSQDENTVANQTKSRSMLKGLAWVAAFLPAVVYLATGSEAGCAARHLFKENAPCDINLKNLSASWPWFSLGLLATGIPSFSVNSLVNYLSIFRLLEVIKSSKSENSMPHFVKLLLHAFSTVLTVCFLAFLIGVSVRNPIFSGFEEVQAAFALLLLPQIYFALFGLPLKISQIFNQVCGKNDVLSLLEVIRGLPPAKVAELVEEHTPTTPVSKGATGVASLFGSCWRSSGFLREQTGEDNSSAGALLVNF